MIRPCCAPRHAVCGFVTPRRTAASTDCKSLEVGPGLGSTSPQASSRSAIHRGNGPKRHLSHTRCASQSRERVFPRAQTHRICSDLCSQRRPYCHHLVLAYRGRQCYMRVGKIEYPLAPTVMHWWDGIGRDGQTWLIHPSMRKRTRARQSQNRSPLMEGEIVHFCSF